jgi:hypothetical protein
MSFTLTHASSDLQDFAIARPLICIRAAAIVPSVPEYVQLQRIAQLQFRVEADAEFCSRVQLNPWQNSKMQEIIHSTECDYWIFWIFNFLQLNWDWQKNSKTKVE